MLSTFLKNTPVIALFWRHQGESTLQCSRAALQCPSASGRRQKEEQLHYSLTLL